jgi:hypothetical protein
MPGYWRRLGAQLRPVLACGYAVRALGTGSRSVTVRAWKWSGKGDVQLRRGGILVGLLFIAWATVKAPQGMVSGVLTAWCLIAWLNAPAAPQETAQLAPAEDDEHTPVEALVRPVIEDRDALLQWLADAIADRNGVHLDELHHRLSQEPGCHTLTRAHITPLLDHHHIPHKRTVSVDGVAGRSGVRQADIRALLKPLPQEAPTPPLNTSETAADLRKSQPLSGHSRPLSPPLSEV